MTQSDLLTFTCWVPLSLKAKFCLEVSCPWFIRVNSTPPPLHSSSCLAQPSVLEAASGLFVDCGNSPCVLDCVCRCMYTYIICQSEEQNLAGALLFPGILLTHMCLPLTYLQCNKHLPSAFQHTRLYVQAHFTKI